MNFEVNVTGAKTVRDKIAAFAGRLRDLKPAFLRSAVVVLTAAQQRIRSDGDGSWAPTLETSRGTSLQRTGALFRSLTLGGSGNVFADIEGGVAVGTNLRTQDGQYSIGELMQRGTGIYGPTGVPITPKNGKFLAFNLNGQKVFVRSVKGSPPRPFLYINDQTAGKVKSVFASYIAHGESAGEA